ncbi:MAG: hypothetical protein H7A36_02225 [Chlamydiales bacterium]|nr:hypothetical protein [Chlamydiales bacterium]
MILFGFQHCGKTYYGRRLAKELKLPFLDTDHLISKKVGYSYRRLWKEGEERFRLVEREVIAELPPNHVIALGGGAILCEENRKVLTHFPLLYLKLSREKLRARYADPKKFEALYEKRLPLYEAIGARCIELDGKSDKEVLWEATH